MCDRNDIEVEGALEVETDNVPDGSKTESEANNGTMHTRMSICAVNQDALGCDGRCAQNGVWLRTPFSTISWYSGLCSESAARKALIDESVRTFFLKSDSDSIIRDTPTELMVEEAEVYNAWIK